MFSKTLNERLISRTCLVTYMRDCLINSQEFFIVLIYDICIESVSPRVQCRGQLYLTFLLHFTAPEHSFAILHKHKTDEYNV